MKKQYMYTKQTTIQKFPKKEIPHLKFKKKDILCDTQVYKLLFNQSNDLNC